MADNEITKAAPDVKVDFEKIKTEFDRIVSEQVEKIGFVNIIVAGDTGVGKSTLINGVFGEKFTNTGSGAPITEEAEWFTKDGSPLRILDTKGFEKREYKFILETLRGELEKANKSKNAHDHIHVAWLCINEATSRVEPSHRDLARLLSEFNVSNIVVLTKHGMDPDFIDQAPLEFIKSDEGRPPAKVVDYIAVRAAPYKKLNLNMTGLDKLVLSTLKQLPEAAKAAFISAQKIDLDLKMQSAKIRINYSTAAAASIAPIPGIPDIMTIVPIQAAMIVSVSLAFGMELDQVKKYGMITTVLGCATSTMTGRWAAGKLLDFIPGAGWIINGIVAGTITNAFGRLYAEFLYRFIIKTGVAPTAEEVAREFPEFYSNNKDKTEI
ncbi:GTPase [Methylobacterium sp. Leaf123]|uniref:GTPase n=1 Tax=Methylobacterium sp. Leaf123 TaxID=1736264 RepID=UPI0009E8C7D9|nr:GTPase [Methylobacterium sp. Leaf123]